MPAKKKKPRKFKIDVLMTGPGGVLYFKPVMASKDDLSELINREKNTLIESHIKQELKKKTKKKKKKAKK